MYFAFAKQLKQFQRLVYCSPYNCADRFNMDGICFDDFKTIAQMMRRRGITVLDASSYWDKLTPFIASKTNDHQTPDPWDHGREDGKENLSLYICRVAHGYNYDWIYTN